MQGGLVPYATQRLCGDKGVSILSRVEGGTSGGNGLAPTQGVSRRADAKKRSLITSVLSKNSRTNAVKEGNQKS